MTGNSKCRISTVPCLINSILTISILGICGNKRLKVLTYFVDKLNSFPPFQQDLSVTVIANNFQGNHLNLRNA